MVKVRSLLEMCVATMQLQPMCEHEMCDHNMCDHNICDHNMCEHTGCGYSTLQTHAVCVGKSPGGVFTSWLWWQEAIACLVGERMVIDWCGFRLGAGWGMIGDRMAVGWCGN